jgi:glycerol-3-phosphate dehydrogenase
MNRLAMLAALEANTQWDIVIIGGGATGLGAAVDAASRGFKTLLVEKDDFAKGTSSRSTKLVHGGVRYLAQGNIKLVREALKERGLLLKNAAHVCSTCSFVIPAYRWWEKWYYGIGLKLYDFMSGSLSLGNTHILSKQRTAEELPGISLNQLRGGVIYTDGQFDDARLAINLAQTAATNGATLLNYCLVETLEKKEGKLTSIQLTDTINRKKYTIHSNVFINATGVFTDALMRMDNAEHRSVVTASQGVHLVAPASFFKGNKAMMIPKTTDGRVLFAVPWHNNVVIGTTDIPVNTIEAEPNATEQEIQFILNNFNQYSNVPLARKDVKAVFAGLRPLVKIPGKTKTALMPRDHTVIISESGMISITGGKWTTYRKMAKDVVDSAIDIGKLPTRPCVTETLAIHGHLSAPDKNNPLHYYGTNLSAINALEDSDPMLKEKIHPLYPYTKALVVWAVQEEMGMTVEDVLSRRIRLLLLDAGAAVTSAPIVAKLMAKILDKDDEWITLQISDFKTVAAHYQLPT